MVAHTFKVVPLQPFGYLLLDVREFVHQRSRMLLDCIEALLEVSASELRVIQDGGLDPFARGHRVRYPLVLSAKVHVSEPLILAVRVYLKREWID